MDDSAVPWSRELNYYRRECNDLGARLLRLQEEQSHAFREARRSRTVVKLLREAYRLGDLAQTTEDVGGPMLELLVDNTLCDRALLLREEPIGSGNFLLAQAIGLADTALSAQASIKSPPSFLYTAGPASPGASARDVVAAVGVPFVLWAYDRGSGHALVIGNRSESNASRPFEPGDQELIEAALSVYLDVLYRKQAEAQLRQAKQAAEAANQARAAALAALAEELQEPLQAIADLADRLQAGRPASVSSSPADPRDAEPRDIANEIGRLLRYVGLVLDGATEQPETAAPAVSLDVEWVPIDDMMRAALRSAYAASVKLGVDIESNLPRRRTAVLADRKRIQHVVQHLVASVMRSAATGGAVRISASRRSDGGLEILVGARGGTLLGTRHAAPERQLPDCLLPERSAHPAGEPHGTRLSFARSIVEAHGGTLTSETSAFGGRYARLVLPARSTRDIDLAEASS
jgi:K+-sensing histidine kinase KdpD